MWNMRQHNVTTVSKRQQFLKLRSNYYRSKLRSSPASFCYEDIHCHFTFQIYEVGTI